MYDVEWDVVNVINMEQYKVCEVQTGSSQYR